MHLSFVSQRPTSCGQRYPKLWNFIMPRANVSAAPGSTRVMADEAVLKTVWASDMPASTTPVVSPRWFDGYFASRRSLIRSGGCGEAPGSVLETVGVFLAVESCFVGTLGRFPSGSRFTGVKRFMGVKALSRLVLSEAVGRFSLSLVSFLWSGNDMLPTLWASM